MKQYRQVPEDAEYREVYDSYRLTVQNLIDTDFLYKTSLSNGQVYFDNDEVYGMVNNQAAIRNHNIIITKEYIDDFVIRDFILYCRSINNLITLNINCNLHDYRDGKPHFLYVVLSNKGKYEVYDDMFQTNEQRILFARFIVDTQGDSVQFYMMLPFAGSADYIKGTQFYQVTDGLRVEVINNSSKELTLSKAKIRFSAINFDDNSSPDCLTVDFEGASVPIRYVRWDSTDNIPRVDWEGLTQSTLTQNKIMDYTTGELTTIDADKFTIQKLYYDVYEKCIVAMYGDQAFNTREAAVLSVDNVLNYPLPDGIEYMIPIAAVISQNSATAYSEDNFRVVNLDYNEKEVMDSDTFTRQQAAEAIAKSTEALNTANSVSSNLTNHVGDRTNPHRVALNQLYNSQGQQVAIDDEYANYTVQELTANIMTSVGNAYYAKTGGTISGNASITGTLSVTGKTTLNALEINGATTLGGDITPKTNNTYSIGSSISRLAALYSVAIDVNSASRITGTLTSASILPVANNSYDLGTTDYRYRNIYTGGLNASGAASITGALSAGNTTISGTLSTSGNATFSGAVIMNQGQLRMGNYTLRLGSTGGIDTAYGYALV